MTNEEKKELKQMTNEEKKELKQMTNEEKWGRYGIREIPNALQNLRQERKTNITQTNFKQSNQQV